MSSKFKHADITNYQIKETLGQGAYGSVVTGIDLLNKQSVAIKILPKLKNSRKNLKNEVDALRLIESQCNNYFLCYINETEDNDNYYIITEYLSGYIMLSSILGDPDFLNRSRLTLIVNNLIDAVIFLHHLKMAHRDLKPENILINRNTCQIKIIDFGLTCHLNCPKYGVSGTPSYQPPEAFPLNIDQIWSIQQRQMADLFALGNIIWILLSMQTLTRFEVWKQNQTPRRDISLKEYFRLYQFPSDLVSQDHSILRIFARVKPTNPSHDFEYSLISMLTKDPNERSFFQAV